MMPARVFAIVAAGVALVPGVGSAGVPVGANGDVYTYTMTQQHAPELPVRWDPCAPLRWSWVGKHSRLDARRARSAFRSIRQVNGQRFRRSDPATADITLRYGRMKRSPEHGELPEGATQLGHGGFQPHPTTAGSLQVPKFGRAVFSPKLRKHEPNVVQQVFLHEIGHAYGLGHSESQADVMWHQTRDTAAVWGPGDLAGLKSLAAGGCLESPGETSILAAHHDGGHLSLQLTDYTGDYPDLVHKLVVLTGPESSHELQGFQQQVVLPHDCGRFSGVWVAVQVHTPYGMRQTESTLVSCPSPSAVGQPQ